ncbi:MAG: hypothetical protein CO182_01510, partial [Lysobacterales bacterium CG_4_9_14_3_um_filter_62_6]
KRLDKRSAKHAQSERQETEGLLERARQFDDGTPSPFLRAQALADPRTAALTEAKSQIAQTRSTMKSTSALSSSMLELATAKTRHLFTGEQLSPSTGLGYHRARWLAFEVGRFTQMDLFEGTLGDPMSLHKYSYTRGNPANGIDPSGMFTLPSLMSALSSSIAGGIYVNLVVKPLMKRVVKAAAFAAIASVGAITSTRQRDDPKSPPMFFVGNDYPEISAHVAEAFESKPIRPIVHRLSVPHDRDWLRTNLTRGLCGPGLSGGSTGNDCDEFPMAIHAEGGKANFMQGRVSVKAASLGQNRGIGGKLRDFHSRCKIKADGPGLDGAYVFATTTLPTYSICGANQ